MEKSMTEETARELLHVAASNPGFATLTQSLHDYLALVADETLADKVLYRLFKSYSDEIDMHVANVKQEAYDAGWEAGTTDSAHYGDYL